MKKLYYYFISISLLFSSSVLLAQDEDKRWAASVHGGTAIMQGDGEVGNLNPVGGVSLKYSLANNFSVRVLLMGGSMESKNLGEAPSIYRTTTSFYEGNVQALLNIVNFKSQNTGKNVAQLYVGIGAGYTGASIKYSPGMPPTEATSVSSITIPFSAGIRFYISPLIDLGFEYSIKGSFSDHLDGFAPIGTANKSNDYYNIPQAYVAFNLGSFKSARNIEWIEQTEKLYAELIKAKKEAQSQIENLRIQNEKLMVDMKKDLNTQMVDNQRKADSSMRMMQTSMKNDSDSDGVSNIFDKEPNSPAHAIVDGGGRMLDIDKDGVPDYIDKCPTVPGKASSSGCPVQPTKTQLTTISDGIKNLQFETGKAIIKSTSFPALNALAKMLNENTTFSFKIEGHTDNVGNPTENLNLSLQRAESVRLFLISKGVDGARITAKGYGDTKPIVSNDTAAGKAKNRRVDMTIE